MRVTWTNARTVPSKGWNRSLAITALTVRQIASRVFQVMASSAEANNLSITQVPVNAPTPVDPAPGAWVAYLNSLGQPAQWIHESQLYSTTQGVDSYNNPSRPAADSLTATTTSRNDFYVSNLTVAPNPIAGTAPYILGLSMTPAASYYNVGQPVTFNGTAEGTSLRYVWYIPGGTNVTTFPTWTTQIIQPGYSTVKLRAVDAYGSVATGTLPYVVNYPPLFSYLTATPNNVSAPFSTTLFADVYDPDGDAFTTSWSSGTQFIGYGTTVPGYYVTQSQVVTCTAVDVRGGTSVADLRLVAAPTNPPVVSLSSFQNTAKSNWPVTLQFSAVASDPDNKGITPAWTFWDDTTTSGNTQLMQQFANGTLCLASYGPHSVPTGYQLFDITVANQDGLTATAGAGINFIPNQIPQLKYLTASAPAIAIGSVVYFAALAVDPDGDTLSYSWNFPGQGMNLYGPNVNVSSAGMQANSTIAGQLTVDDGFGGVIRANTPIVDVFSTQLPPIRLSEPGGFYTQSVNVAVLAVNPTNNLYALAGAVFGTNTAIRYTTDSSIPQQATDGLPYTGPVLLPFASGFAVTFSARAFQDGFVPSAPVSATYNFYTPPGAGGTSTTTTTSSSTSSGTVSPATTTTTTNTNSGVSVAQGGVAPYNPGAPDYASNPYQDYYPYQNGPILGQP